jgi:large subunit ribosomal protein L22
MESTHILKNANVSLRKVRTFLPLIKKMQPTIAVQKLSFMPHSAARVLLSCIKSALASAELALKVPKNMLEFRALKADQGMTLKRFRAGSRGTALPIVRRMTHITVVLSVKGVDNVSDSDLAKKNERTDVLDGVTKSDKKVEAEVVGKTEFIESSNEEKAPKLTERVIEKKLNKSPAKKGLKIKKSEK